MFIFLMELFCAEEVRLSTTTQKQDRFVGQGREVRFDDEYYNAWSERGAQPNLQVRRS